MSAWTDDEIAKLKQLASEGLKTSDIGKQIGKNRSQVIGMARRKHIALIFARPVKNDSSHIRRRAAAAAYMRSYRNSTSVSPYKARSPASPKPKPLSTFVLTIYDLRDGLCKFPSNEDRPPYRYCGQECELGTSWCEQHADVVFSSGSILTGT